MNVSTFLDQMIYDINPIDDEPTDVESINDHEIIEQAPQPVASSCTETKLRYAPVTASQCDNFLEDEALFELTPSEPPENNSTSEKECFSSLVSEQLIFSFVRNSAEKFIKA